MGCVVVEIWYQGTAIKLMPELNACGTESDTMTVIPVHPLVTAHCCHSRPERKLL